MKNEKINRPNFISPSLKEWGIDTRLTHMGRRTKDDFGFINPSVYHASTVCYASSEHMRQRDGAYTYGIKATPTMDAFGKGFLMVSATPLTRSSYHAGDDFARLRAAREAKLANG